MFSRTSGRKLVQVLSPLLVVVLTLLLPWLVNLAEAATDDANAIRTNNLDGRTIYESNCASCHGSDGRGRKPEETGIEITIRDFSDCAFSTRESVRDWIGVAHSGGPVRVFDERMPAFGGRLSVAELDHVVRYIKSFCKSDAWPPGELNFARGILTEKAYLENELLLISTFALEGPLDIAGKLIYEKRVGPRSQLELIAPYGVFRRSNADRQGTRLSRWGKGLGDLAFGFKHVLFHDVDLGTILSAASELALPTGNTGDGLGNGTFLFEPFVAAGQRLSTLGFIQVQGGIGLPFNESKASKEAYGRLALGRTFVTGNFGRLFTPMLEFQVVREMGNESLTLYSYVPEMQISISKRRHVRINLGVIIPMNELDTRPLQGTTYLMWDWFDGGLNEGF
jgi:mono/diheme cytochrome c family protein